MSYHAQVDPRLAAVATPDLQDLKKSSTGHLRALSKFAQNTDNEDFSLAAPAPSVVGLQGRRQLKRTDSTVGNRDKNSRAAAYGWGDRNWMDKQRQFLAAYEYLCHIGEAKQWIEDIIHKEIPPIVQLEEALRDGVTLAEIVQTFYPDRKIRIFRMQKLTFRHTDNIAVFFNFLADIELPDLFQFELIDLYEKKNTPKVIYCIHALSWLLYRKGMVDFRIGNLVGQLQFDHHELEQTQKGLDKAGVSMPSFKGMGTSFGAEPEPEPELVETEQERIDRELAEHHSAVLELQSQARAALVRMRLSDDMNKLWDAEPMVIELQSRIRGDWARQIIEYRLSMKRFATNLQAHARGYLVRTSQQHQEAMWQSRSKDILKLQNLIRGRRARVEVETLRSQVSRQQHGVARLQAAIRAALVRGQVTDQYEATKASEQAVVSLQAAIRGALARRAAFDQVEAIREVEAEVQQLQASIRAFICRYRLQALRTRLQREVRSTTVLQAHARAYLMRCRHGRQTMLLNNSSPAVTNLQSAIRGAWVRKNLRAKKEELRKHTAAIVTFQSLARAAISREQFYGLKLVLFQQTDSVVKIQSSIRAHLLRARLRQDRQELDRHLPKVIELQSLARAALLRQKVGITLGELDKYEPEIQLLQSLSRAMLVRSQVGELLAELDQHEAAVVEMQSYMRAIVVRQRFAEKQRYFKENMEKVVKIQSIARAKIQGQAYKSLTSGKNPPVGTLKGFVHLLNDSDFDFEEEIEFERTRKTVVQQVRQNEMADQYITQLDIKIALLVKNKITLDEVVKHQRHYGGNVGSLLPNKDLSSKDAFDLRALNKTSRRKLEHYQELFFLLQTQPSYLAKLLRRLWQNGIAEKESEKIKYLMMNLFGYAQKRREEYYLVKLMAQSHREEIEAVQSVQDYLRTTALWHKLFGAYIKSPKDRKFLHEVLGHIVKDSIINNRDLDLETDPLQIYLSSINNEELSTGQSSRRDPSVPREVAIRDPETRANFVHNMQDLRDIAGLFFASFEEVLHKMPYGIRFIGQQMYKQILVRFKNDGVEPVDALQIICNWMWKNYFQVALSEPEKYGIIDRGMTQEQKRNLAEVVKIIGQAASGREFGAENVFLQPLNNFVREAIARFEAIWNQGKQAKGILSIAKC